MPKRLQRKRSAGWTRPEGVIVDRTSRWGNPYRIVEGREHGRRVWFVESEPDAAPYAQTLRRGPFAREEEARSCALLLHEHYAEARHAADPAWLAPLAGRDLLCWCSENQRCHADTLLRLASGGRR